MNERIREFGRIANEQAECCGITTQRNYTAERFFVELLIKDAIDGLLDAYGPDDCLPQEEIAGFLKERFGIYR